MSLYACTEVFYNALPIAFGQLESPISSNLKVTIFNLDHPLQYIVYPVHVSKSP